MRQTRRKSPSHHSSGSLVLSIASRPPGNSHALGANSGAAASICAANPASCGAAGRPTHLGSARSRTLHAIDVADATKGAEHPGLLRRFTPRFDGERSAPAAPTANSGAGASTRHRAAPPEGRRRRARAPCPRTARAG